jgi:hypothetical protein
MNYSFQNLGKAGRLGNQLWQIAWVYSQAKKNLGCGRIPSDWDYRHIFNVPEDMYGAPVVSGINSNIDGGLEYFQELDYWNGLHDDIWDMFQPSLEASERTIDYVGEHYDGMISGCSIHHRRGDYLNHPNHFPIPTEKYYQRSMEIALWGNPDTIFYVFSDNIDQIKFEYSNSDFTDKLIKSGQIVFFEGTPRPVELIDRIGEPKDWLDLFAMRLCSQHIIANSTFSWWAAFLSDDESPFVPDVWFGNHTDVARIPWKRMIPLEWKMINVN